ncbi:hypothetical protein FN976_02435 [Caenimonas sedimenti]|uniref:Uncharacterized protein n=1 Tax=Caenimonas sedimenti TaxID=2596921 RepID=A0A562ZXV8_9BURK|nr:hypothetical protein [Caenimonas sedimenti]TWO73115.1 hypothetical protein FN976_02435 [Caenimonas sedimenti]
MTTFVRLSELLDAFEWVSAVGPFENNAYVSRETGKIWLVSDLDDSGDEPPADVDDDSLYLAVPSKNELDLGRSLALEFTEEHVPARSVEVRGFFGRPGAYGKFKSLLDAIGMLDTWHAYESNGIEQALRAWADQNGIQFTAEPP